MFKFWQIACLEKFRACSIAHNLPWFTEFSTIHIKWSDPTVATIIALSAEYSKTDKNRHTEDILISSVLKENYEWMEWRVDAIRYICSIPQSIGTLCLRLGEYIGNPHPVQLCSIIHLNIACIKMGGGLGRIV